MTAISIILFSPIKYYINAETKTNNSDQNSILNDDDDYNDYIDNGCDDDEWGDFAGGELTKYDLTIIPAKGNIKKGESFKIKIIPESGTVWEELTNKEWKEFCKDNFDFVIFRSTNSKVAAVNRITGKVIGRKKGTALIKTTVNISNGETVTFKTKVVVQN